MDLIEELNAAWTAAHSRARTPIAPELLTKAVQEIERLRAKVTKADYLLTQGAPALALEALQTP